MPAIVFLKPKDSFLLMAFRIYLINAVSSRLLKAITRFKNSLAPRTSSVSPSVGMCVDCNLRVSGPLSNLRRPFVVCLAVRMAVAGRIRALAAVLWGPGAQPASRGPR